MKYKITVTQIEPEADYKVREVYEQVIDDLDIQTVIKAVNGIV